MYGDYLLTGKLFCGKCKAPMTGISGTGRSGALHYYYVCQTRRTEKTCDKANLRRDEIELKVAQAIRDYALKDDVIEWIADSTVAYNERREQEGQIGVLQDQLATAQRGIKNIMAAIEQGIITETTKARLLELEAEQSAISAKSLPPAPTSSPFPERISLPAWRCSVMEMSTTRSIRRSSLILS